MANLDPRIEAIREKFGLERSDFWELPQKKGTWLVKHAALELAAVKSGIRFEMPQIIESNSAEGIAVMAVHGWLEEYAENKVGLLSSKHEWATGEASPKNNKNAYPWAMAEKRAKDRVILKLIGVHGLVYSEDEMDDRRARDAEETGADPQTGEIKPPATMGTLPIDKLTGMKNTAQRQLWGRLQVANREVKTLKQFGDLWEHEASRAAFDGFPKDWQELMNDEIRDKAAELNEKFGDVFMDLPPETQKMVRLASMP